MCEKYEFLVEKQPLWAGMLMQVLEDNGIPSRSEEAAGAVKLFVPAQQKAKAEEVLDELFSAYEEEF